MIKIYSRTILIDLLIGDTKVPTQSELIDLRKFQFLYFIPVLKRVERWQLIYRYCLRFPFKHRIHNQSETSISNWAVHGTSFKGTGSLRGSRDAALINRYEFRGLGVIRCCVKELLLDSNIMISRPCERGWKSSSG